MNIICYMMTSIDGRVDCKMTEQLDGVEDYDKVLKELNLKTTVTGRVTAENELALPGRFKTDNPHEYGKEGFQKNAAADGYDVILDSKGTLLWNDDAGSDKPHLILTSEDVSQEYLDYLNEKHISWIAAGKNKVNLNKAVEILGSEFGVDRIGVVGGPATNTAFLEEGLLDEIVLLVGPGIDGRPDMPAVFDGRHNETPVQLALEEAKALPSGAVLLRYHI